MFSRINGLPFELNSGPWDVTQVIVYLKERSPSASRCLQSSKQSHRVYLDVNWNLNPQNAVGYYHPLSDSVARMLRFVNIKMCEKDISGGRSFIEMQFYFEASEALHVIILYYHINSCSRSARFLQWQTFSSTKTDIHCFRRHITYGWVFLKEPHAFI